MKTYPISDHSSGVPFAFEVDSVYLGMPTIARILVDIEGVSSVRKRKPFHKRSDTHIEFSYVGCDYIVWEPFGDSSRYWIGPKEPAKCAIAIGPIEEQFKSHRPSFARQLFGDILSLHVMKRLFTRTR